MISNRVFPTSFSTLLATSLAFAWASVSSAQEASESAAFYAKEVYPILQEHCFKCHGGEEKLKGNFRITSRDGLIAGGDLGTSIDETDPAKSLILELVNYANEDYQMPPKAKLPEAQIATLTAWVVEHGAAYDPALEIEGAPEERRRGFTVSDEDRQWWAYRPIEERALPKVSDPEWEKNGIDAFVLKRLDDAGLKPNPPAEPGVLCRRVFYDLIGLPPSLEEVKQFETAWSEDADTAWKSLVDDLLSRPQYGEKWARHWLDIVRYAESNGFERDNSKPHIWRYRDYVIKAFNDDKPYDQFVTEQIAGDEIANPTLDSITATGFHRLMQWDDEPADRKQHVYDVLADDVLVTSEAFLGMTLGCARCHDHKIDPISQKDYYSFMAFLHGVTHYTTQGTLISWATEEERKQFEENRKRQLAALETKTQTLEKDISDFLEKEGKLAKESDTKPITLVEDARGGGSEWEYTTDKPTPDWHEVGFRNKAWQKANGGFGTAGTPNAEVRTNWNTPDIWMRTTFGLEALPKSLAMEIHHDEDVEVYLNGQLVYEASGYLTDYETIILPESALAALQTGRNVIAVHCHQTGGGQYIDLALRTGVVEGFDPSEIFSGKRSGRFKPLLTQHFGRDVLAEWKELQNQANQLRNQKPGIAINAVTETGGEIEPLQIHMRGSAHAPGDEVVPAFPSVLGTTDEPEQAVFAPVEHDGRKTSGRRLALAKWMTSPANPLTSRVIMNRLWQHHFGRGIAASTNDFGKLGEAPTHPELLEWLAARLMQQGWSLKAMHRLILDSHTYRMSSAPNEAALAMDPENRLFWRYNMRRLTAEELRDSVLAISGNLNLETGGEWVYPPLPPEVLATASRPGQGWPISGRKEDHYRRSIYIHVKRSLRHQMLADFDQADTDSPCAVRFATTVPTQALAMLNSAFVNEQAVVLADHLRENSDQPEEQVRLGLALAMQREPNADEVRQCLNFMESVKSQSGLDDKAALERFALLTLNLNEFVFLD
ncbi:MAG: PSD1 domain-containing protein [Verrucomicrobiae bacterium]|nr:PSD1 domain-containing protein [Verrucomicrobiae bacterium]